MYNPALSYSISEHPLKSHDLTDQNPHPFNSFVAHLNSEWKVSAFSQYNPNERLIRLLPALVEQASSALHKALARFSSQADESFTNEDFVLARLGITKDTDLTIGEYHDKFGWRIEMIMALPALSDITLTKHRADTHPWSGDTLYDHLFGELSGFGLAQSLGVFLDKFTGIENTTILGVMTSYLTQDRIKGLSNYIELCTIADHALKFNRYDLFSSYPMFGTTYRRLDASVIRNEVDLASELANIADWAQADLPEEDERLLLGRKAVSAKRLFNLYFGEYGYDQFVFVFWMMMNTHRFSGYDHPVTTMVQFLDIITPAFYYFEIEKAQPESFSNLMLFNEEPKVQPHETFADEQKKKFIEHEKFKEDCPFW